jgi:CubicO group peptidase (beta-lactamase class C family)
MKTKTFNRIVICSLALLLLGAALAQAQEEAAPARSIELKKVMKGLLKIEKTHAYTIPLKADQFVYGEVDQITVDVVVTVKDPEGKTVGNYDTPARGPEPFHFDSKAEGEYRIEVKPFEKLSGEYSIELKRVESKAKDPKKRVDQLMAAYIDADIPGAAVAVIQKGKVIFSKAYGMANLTYSIPFTTETLNNIGSTSKQFTSFAINLLAKQGKLSLDDDVRKHIPELQDFGKTITLRHLLSHTSGYREFLNLLAMAGRNLGEGDYINRDELITIVQKQPALQNDPGAEWNYNNTGFGLLATVVERVSEQSFPDWMAENVFEPLGMTHTLVRAQPRQIVQNSAQGYVVDKEGGFQEGRDLSASTGAGGIYATVGDLAKWINNFRTGKVGGNDIIKQMTTRFVLTTGDTTNYGMGLFIDKHRSLDRIQHGGADIAHRSMLMYYPDIDAGVITQSNNALFPGNIPNDIAEAFFEKHMKPEEKETPEETDSAPFNPEDYDPKEFDEIAGRFELEAAAGFVITFTREEDKFFGQGTGQPKVEMVPTSDSTFTFVGVEASMTFHRNKENKVETLTLHQNGHHKAKRLKEEPWKPTPEDLAEYTGRFFSEELETFYTLAVKDSSLVVRHKRWEDLKLTPAKTDTFNATFPIQELIFIRNDDGETDALKVSNGRTKEVRFEKK